MQTARLDNALLRLKNLTDELTLSLPLDSLKESIRKLRLPGFDWPTLRIGEKVARVPVVQGGMGVGISLSGLASAVAEAGGIGIIAANAIGMLEKDYYKDGRAANLRALRREIREARSRTDGLIGVNIMVAVNDFHELLDVAIEEKVDLIFMGAGLPVKDIPVARMRENGVKAVPIVSSARAADMIFRMWKKIYKDVPDAVVCEGPLAGGHLGFSAEQIDDPEFRIQNIIPAVVDALRPYETEFSRQIPVIAAGGIYTGDDIFEEIGLGASGVQMGTRFVATEECDADEKFKQAYVACTEDQIGLIKSPVGMPGRAIRNDFITDSEAGKRPSFTCAWQCLASCKAEASRYCISIALNNARKGRIDKGFVFVGANAHRVKEIVPVATLINELAEGFRVKARATVTRRLDAMVARVREARDSGVDQIQKRYDEVLAGLRELRSLVTEGMRDSSRA